HRAHPKAADSCGLSTAELRHGSWTNEASSMNPYDTDGDYRPWSGEEAAPQSVRWAAPNSMSTVKTATTRPSLLVVDDEAPVLRVMQGPAAKGESDARTGGGASEGRRALMRNPADLAMVDLRMPDVNGLDLLRQIRQTTPSCEVILMTAYAAV